MLLLLACTDEPEKRVREEPACTVEVCNGGIDDDCDGLADGQDPDVVGATQGWTDGDGDGYGVNAVPVCEFHAGIAEVGGDCDDESAAIHPLAIEVCDGIDNDCDTAVDAADLYDTSTEITVYPDRDEDGYGDDRHATQYCGGPPQAETTPGDCNDLDPLINPRAIELCDAIDNDCDGEVDDTEACALRLTVDSATWPSITADGSRAMDVAVVGVPDAVSPVDVAIGFPGWSDGTGYFGRIVVAARPVGAEQIGDEFGDVLRGVIVGDVDGHVGRSVVGPGDVNGDGAGDLLYTITGGCLAWECPARSALLLGPLVGSLSTPVLTMPGGGEPHLLAGGADLSGDGVPDLLAGWDDPEYGAAYVVSADRTGDMNVGTVDARVVSDEEGDSILSVAMLPDWDGDGIGDLAMSVSGRFHEGRVGVIPGPISGAMSLGEATATIYGEPDDMFGSTLAWVGDVDGDGRDDLGATALHSNGGTPFVRVFVYVERDDLFAADAWMSAAPLLTQRAWTTVDRMGDFDLDGYGEIAIGAPDGGDREGIVGIVPGGHSATIVVEEFQDVLEFEGRRANFGNALAGGEDVDGDGILDLLAATRSNADASLILVPGAWLK